MSKLVTIKSNKVTSLCVLHLVKTGKQVVSIADPINQTSYRL